MNLSSIILSYVARNWSTVIQAPLAFAALFALAVIVISPFIFLLFRAEIRGKNATIEEKSATIERLKGENDRLAKQATDKFHVNRERKALEITVGSGEDFVTFKRYSPHKTQCEVYILVTNIGNGLLSDFLVQVTDSHPPIGNLPRTAAPASTILPGEPRRVCLATYFTSSSDDGKGPPVLRFAEYYAGGYGHNFFRFDPVDLPRADKPLLFTVRAKAFQCDAAEARMRLIIEESGRLKVTMEI